VELSQKLLDAVCRKGAALKHCFLSSSGAMANENAFKILFQKKEPAARRLAFERCFAGRSMVTAQVTDNPGNRKGLPKVMNVDYVPFFNALDPEGSTKEAVGSLKGHLARHPKEYAGMCMELVQGEGGFYPGDKTFFMELIQVLKENGIPVMVD